jgi:hypothetical protein
MVFMCKRQTTIRPMQKDQNSKYLKESKTYISLKPFGNTTGSFDNGTCG